MSAQRYTSEDLALFAMQLLPEKEAAEIAAYLEQNEEARRELAQIQGDLAIYAHTVDLHSPPALTRERLMKQVAREKKAIPMERAAVAPASVDTLRGSSDVRGEENSHVPFSNRGLGSGSYLEDEIPQRGGVARVFPWIGWAAAAGFAVMAGNLYYQQQHLQSTIATQARNMDHLSADAAAARQVLDALTDSSAMRVTLTKGKEAPVPQGRATYVANKGALIFVASNLEALPAEKTYELWLIPAAAGGTPIPAGTFIPDERGNASVILPPLPKGVDAKAFGVTIENKEGSTTPTMPIILAGA